ncbi:MAG: FKBP-type peptidyl-prolyl cis-trans isomerase [Muribaculaceae bacterium]|nr:FKBP-type peptidyl-prolyl cis-trans isomerase [Muribaculaceae bacterium]
MKKVLFLIAVAAAAMTAQAASPEFIALQDSLSENFGNVYGASIATVYANKPAADKAEFLRGYQIVMQADTTQAAFLDGIALAMDFKKMTQEIQTKQHVTINKDKFSKAFVNSFMAAEQMPQEQVMKLNEKLQSDMQRLNEMAKLDDPTFKAGQEYLRATVAADPAYKMTASGIAYKMHLPGNGNTFKETDRVRLNYKGQHINGDVFDQSNDTTVMGVNRVVPGFKEALMLMSPGSKMTVIIPSDLAYGSRGAGGAIKPHETLVFDIETYGVEEPAPKKGEVSATPESQHATINPDVKTIAPKRKGKK